MIVRRVVAVSLIWIIAVSAQATIFESYSFSSAANQGRYQALIEELRCLVCQNQSVAESDADLAADLRRETHRMIEAGRTDEQIMGFMVQRYGDFVRYHPPLRTTTVLLWWGPIGFVVFGLGLLALSFRTRKRRSR